MKIQWKQLLFAVLVPLGLAAIVGVISGAAQGYGDFVKPPLSPPGWLFPVVWTILYTMMGIAFYLVQQQGGPCYPRAARLYWIQLGMNLLWSLIFFNLRAYGFAFVWLIALWAVLLFTILTFYAIDKRAAVLMVPYFLWVTFAAYLNFGVFLLN